ncbi:MAG: hypothetical protein M3Q69_16670 [Acidobacteriota bacterium]|nr:hypothetical protein [Acidobacteriota bacterium]
MTRRFTTLTLFVCLLAATNAFAAMEGMWTAAIDRDGSHPDRIYLNITRDDLHGNTFNHTGTTFPKSAFANLSDAQINAAAMTPVKFELRREAGTVTFEGMFRGGKGAGEFTFAPSANYLEAIRALGIEVSERRKHGRSWSEEESLLQYALHDVSTAFIRSMIGEGYRVSLEKYLEMRIFNITPEYIREMRSLGFKQLDSDDLIATKIHKVTPDYVRQMRAAGWDLSLDDLQSSRIHGATPAFAAEMKQLGYTLDFDDLVAFRIHRVTPEFIRDLADLGYKHVDADDLVSMRIHGVTTEYIRMLKAAGYTGVPVEKLVAMKIHGIDARMLEKMK